MEYAMQAGVGAQASASGRVERIAARLPIYLADMRARPGWTFMFLFGRVMLLRRLAAMMAPRADLSLAAAPAVQANALSDQPIATVLDALRVEGISTGLRLPAAVVADIRAFAESRPCFGNMSRQLPFLPANHAEAERRFGRNILVGHFLETVLECPAAVQVSQNPWLQAIAAEYFQARPTVIATRLWWSFPSDAPSSAELSLASQNGFHFDLDDWQQLKVFFYLTDVDVTSGAHLYVRGSHRRHPLSHQFTLFVGKSESKIVATYGADAIQMVRGPAGTGFIEDPFGYHTGTALQQGRRLVLEVSFGISDLLDRRRFGEVAQ